MSSAEADLLHVVKRHLGILLAPDCAQPIDKVNELSIIELLLEARHRLHALEPGETLTRNAFQNRVDEVAWAGEPQRGIRGQRYNHMGNALTLDAMAS